MLKDPRIDRLAGVLGELKKILPQDPLPISNVSKTVTLMRAKIASLPLGGVPPEIASRPLGGVPPEMADFLKKCAADGGAPLSDLTPEIFKWIRDQGFAGDLRVKPR